jgi:hypothetical protein
MAEGRGVFCVQNKGKYSSYMDPLTIPFPSVTHVEEEALNECNFRVDIVAAPYNRPSLSACLVEHDFAQHERRWDHVPAESKGFSVPNMICECALAEVLISIS